MQQQEGEDPDLWNGNREEVEKTPVNIFDQNWPLIGFERGRYVGSKKWHWIPIFKEPGKHLDFIRNKESDSFAAD